MAFQQIQEIVCGPDGFYTISWSTAGRADHFSRIQMRLRDNERRDRKQALEYRDAAQDRQPENLFCRISKSSTPTRTCVPRLE